MWIIIKIMSKNQSGLFFWVKKKFGTIFSTQRLGVIWL